MVCLGVNLFSSLFLLCQGDLLLQPDFEKLEWKADHAAERSDASDLPGTKASQNHCPQGLGSDFWWDCCVLVDCGRCLVGVALVGPPVVVACEPFF